MLSARKRDASLNDVSAESTVSKTLLPSKTAPLPATDLYAVTVNVSPFKVMNKKLWKTYAHDDQRKILMRIEAAFRKKTPSCILKELHYEVCPSLDNIHYHALYCLPDPQFVSEMTTYFDRICSTTDTKTRVPFRHINIQEVYDEPTWLLYIRKDLKN
jgi:hypothetical protein